MSTIASVVGELVLVSPGEQVKIWVSQDGLTVLTGSEPMRRIGWYLSRLRALRLAIRHGRAPKGCFVLAKPESPKNKAWCNKMIDAAQDVLRQYQRPAIANDGPRPNDVLRGIGSPYRVRL